MCELSVEELQSNLRTKVNVGNVCLQLPNIGNVTIFALCFQMTFAKSGPGTSIKLQLSVITCINSGISSVFEHVVFQVWENKIIKESCW
jgi:hypothetical protein